MVTVWRFKRYKESPPILEKYVNEKSVRISKAVKGRNAANKMKCKALNKITKEIFKADSILELSTLTNLHTTTIRTIIKNQKHKKWLILKE